MRFSLSTLLVLSLTLARAQSPQAIAEYIERYKAVAIEEMKTYGIPASITLAQGIHESGSGASALATNANNHFGIKCHDNWAGQTYYHDDDKPQECFRVYNSAEESFRDHSQFLKTRSRYANLFTLEPGDYHGWAKGLKAAGYATNPRYPDIIIKLIEDYNLSQFDNPNGQVLTSKTQAKDTAEIEVIKQSLAHSNPSNLLVTPAAVKTNHPAVSTSKDIHVAEVTKQSSSQSSPPPAPVVVEEKRPQLDLSKYNFEEKSVNNTIAIAKKDLPLDAIAQKYNITIEQIYAFNDMTAGTKLYSNDLIYVENKKPESIFYQYEISTGETMRDVAQKFGVQLSALTKRNGLASGCEPLPGEVVVLRGRRDVPIRFRAPGKTIPTPKPVFEDSPTENKVHTVGSNETLYSISKQYNISLENLKRINGIKDESIKIGQTLIVSL